MSNDQLKPCPFCGGMNRRGAMGEGEGNDYLPPVHPADVLIEDFMKPLGWDARDLASESGLPEWLCEELARKVARFTEGVSDRLGDTFGISRDLFRNLQLQYDRETGTPPPPPPAANQADSIQTLLSASEGIANEIREAARKIIQKYGWDKEEKE